MTASVALPVSPANALTVQIRGSLHFGLRTLDLAITLHYLGAAATPVPLVPLTDQVGGIRVMWAAVVVAAVLLELLGEITAS